MLIQIMKKFQVEGLYIEGNPVLVNCFEKFSSWMEKTLPELHSHFVIFSNTKKRMKFEFLLTTFHIV